MRSRVSLDTAIIAARPIASVCAVLLLSSCTTDEARKTGADAGVLFGQAMTATGGAVQRAHKSLQSTDLLRTFHDAAEHSEESVLTLLRSAGVGHGGKAGTRRSRATAQPGPGKAAPEAEPLAGSIAEGQLRWPIDVGVISSEYGNRWGRRHRGIDIAGAIGTPIFAVADGEVIYAGSGLSGYGNVVILRRADDVSTLYAHNSELKVSRGQRVRQGDVVSLLGNSGRSTGPHLHFEIRSYETALDPRTVLPPTRLTSGFSPSITSAALEP